MNKRSSGLNRSAVEYAGLDSAKLSSKFGKRAFLRQDIEKNLPKKISANWIAAMSGLETIHPDHLDHIATALRHWAQKQGATHYTHWFQPLRANAAEKHDAFLNWRKGPGEVIEQLSGKELLKGEADGSSFPSGGLRTTAAARGMTIWDPSSYPFLWEDSEGLTLCIPALFVTWTGQALDYKIPLLRSEQKINRAVLRLLKLAKIDAKFSFSTLGPEQEYFIVDRAFYDQRPDLTMCGRTVFGAPPSKGQELQEHYYSAPDQRVLAYMRDFEDAALLLGIPIKTRHNEVAIAQHEMAPLFEKSSTAADHNLMLMELMRQIALRHDLVCLFHEKPFAGMNGSGKHCNWSVATDQGLNLLDPKKESFPFLVFLTAVLRAVREHAALLRSSIGSAQNDHRLGGHEAPPTILSVYLGQELEKIISQIIHHRKPAEEIHRLIDLGLSNILPIEPDNADRNRTSFFAFNMNRFEFRAVGSSQNVAWPVTVINSIVADSLNLILDEIEDALSRKRKGHLLDCALPVLREHLKFAEPVIFSGDNYDSAWKEEAKRRKLPNIPKSYHAFAVLRDPKTKRVFQEVLSQDELSARQEVYYELYARQMNIECNLMCDLFRTQILPAALEYQKSWAKSVAEVRKLNLPEAQQMKRLEIFTEQINEAISAIDELEQIQKQAKGLGWEALGKVFCELANPRMEKARRAVDLLEGAVDDSLWPLPKYRELFIR